ncbi:hypothetical protein [Micromonospora sp. RP3T]|uniref:hypothetical protein n=1 Tax=Micromonospora sp. RP3T TaxID=2135446 RepID=UPI003D72B754
MGTVDLHLVDRSRADPWTASPVDRELMVSLWYPARAVRTAETFVAAFFDRWPRGRDGRALTRPAAG